MLSTLILLLAASPSVSWPSSVPPQSLVYDDFGDTSAIQLNGVATTLDTPDGRVLRLVPADRIQGGSAFYSSMVPISRFSCSFEFRITDRGGIVNGGDGFTFLIQNQGVDALGGLGEGLGYHGIMPSIAVEFDTYQNSSQSDPSSNHIGFLRDGILNHSSLAQLPSQDIALDLDDGDHWFAWIDYDGATVEFRLSTDGIRPKLANLEYRKHLPTALGASSAFIGFTASTYNAYENIDIIRWEYGDFASILAMGAFTPGVAGQNNVAILENANPGSQMGLFASLNPGSAYHPRCADVDLDLDQPTLCSVVQASSTGTATFSKSIPLGLAGTKIYFQGARLDACRVSNRIEQVFH